jgi:3-carboxy-cis,cis-muconate cycloisomerase
MTVSPFDHPILGGLLGDEEMKPSFAAEADGAAMLAFEAALARAQAAAGLIPSEAVGAIAAACAALRPDIAQLRSGMTRDGVPVPALVTALRAAVGQPHAAHIHFGATSQDAIDTALVLRLKPVLGVIDRRLAHLSEQLAGLAAREGHRIVMGRTRMQDALLIPLAHRIASWREPLVAHREHLAMLQPRLLVLQLGGAVGTLDKFGGKGGDVARAMASELGLTPPEAPWHTSRHRIVEFAGLLSLITGSLGKMGQDIALMAQTPVREVSLRTGGGSSAMPHKSNPVRAEALVTLARFNATLVGGVHQALVHENERSGAAWTLEWMLLPQMVMAAGASLRLAAELLRDLDFQTQ